MAAATARGTSDACIFAWPSPLRAAVLSKRCDLGHRTKLSIESRGGATGGARLNRRSARLLRRLTRHGVAVLHDVAIPGTPANADHVVIGPAGVVLVDSKRYTGRVWQGPDGRVWHNQSSMDRPLRALRMEAAAIAELLGVPVRPLVCVHGARVDFAGLAAGEVEIIPAGRLHAILTSPGPQHSPADVGRPGRPRAHHAPPRLMAYPGRGDGAGRAG
jgi:hypothetical protein